MDLTLDCGITVNLPRWLEEDLTQGGLKRYLRYIQTHAEAS